LLLVLSVQADEGYVEYLVILEHVDTWQNLDGLLHSRGQIKSFCHELSKQLEMRYVSPPLPVDLSVRGATIGEAGDEANIASIAQLSAESEGKKKLS
jgi:hypothetical protein